LHLVGILFPHINDDERAKSHQIYINLLRCTENMHEGQEMLHT